MLVVPLPSAVYTLEFVQFRIFKRKSIETSLEMGVRFHTTFGSADFGRVQPACTRAQVCFDFVRLNKRRAKPVTDMMTLNLFKISVKHVNVSVNHSVKILY